jgi:hypothetical protein
VSPYVRGVQGCTHNLRLLVWFSRVVAVNQNDAAHTGWVAAWLDNAAVSY